MIEKYSEIFLCPNCEGELSLKQSNLVCNDCNVIWSIKNDIPSFIEESDFASYSLAPNMKEINLMAKQLGWRETIQGYSNSAENQDYTMEYISSEARADFRFLLPTSNQSGSVVDIGSGWGNMSLAFARTADQVVAIDTTPENLEFIQIRADQEGLKNIITAQAEASCLPLRPNSFDIALLIGVLEWVAWGRPGDPQKLQQKALKRIYESLRPGGCLYLSIENRFSYKYFLGLKEPHTGLRFVSLLPYIIGNQYSRIVRHQEYRELTYSPWALKKLLRVAGFNQIDFMYPIPNYQNFRYITDHSQPQISRFVLNQMRGHPKFSTPYYLAGFFSVILRLHKTLSPSFSVFAYKNYD